MGAVLVPASLTLISCCSCTALPEASVAVQIIVLMPGWVTLMLAAFRLLLMSGVRSARSKERGEPSGTVTLVSVGEISTTLLGGGMSTGGCVSRTAKFWTTRLDKFGCPW